MPVKLDQGSSLERLNMTPVIDCVFLLLIFFLVASKLEEEDRQMRIRLPQASQAQPLTNQPAEIVVSVSREGEFAVRGSQMNLSELEQILLQAAADNPENQTVIIRGDAESRLSDVVAVMNACAKAGVADYRIAAGPQPDQP